MKHWLIAFSLLLVCGVAFFFYERGISHEPYYQGRSLSAWLDAAAYLDEPWCPTRQTADDAVRSMGTNALPFLLDRVGHSKDPESKFKARIAGWMWLHGYKKQAFRYYDTYGQERFFALRSAFIALRSDEEEVVPILIDIARNGDTNRQDAAMYGLWEIRSESSVPFLLQEASSTNSQKRGFALGCLAQMHTHADLVIPLLIKGLQDPEFRVRKISAGGLLYFGPQAREAVPLLQRFLKEEEEALKTSPYSSDHRAARGFTELSLNAIIGTTNELIVQPR